MSKKRVHGERNKTLSENLFAEKVYFDWTVTTAFYSAIHFVEDKILPCILNDKKCKNINEVKKAYKQKGRHAAREKLVQNKMSINASTSYKWLDDKSRYARYTTYKVTNSEAEKAKRCLDVIYSECPST